MSSYHGAKLLIEVEFARMEDGQERVNLKLGGFAPHSAMQWVLVMQALVHLVSDFMEKQGPKGVKAEYYEAEVVRLFNMVANGDVEVNSHRTGNSNEENNSGTDGAG